MTRTMLLTSALILSCGSAFANDHIINGGRGGAGGAGGTGTGGTATLNANLSAGAAATSASRSTLTVAPGAIGSGNSGGNANVNAAPSFGLPSYGGGSQCGTVGFGVAISPSGGGAFGPAWESTNCRNYNIALTMLNRGKEAEGWELMAMITPEAAKVLAGHPAPIQPAAAPTPVRTFDCNKVLHDTSGRAMSYDDLTTYHHCNTVRG